MQEKELKEKLEKLKGCRKGFVERAIKQWGNQVSAKTWAIRTKEEEVTLVKLNFEAGTKLLSGFQIEKLEKKKVEFLQDAKSDLLDLIEEAERIDFFEIAYELMKARSAVLDFLGE